jgi:LemA protein
MKKGLIIVIAIVAVIAILGGSLVSSYNGLVEKQANVENADAQIQVQLQRRADLIPNLVNTVKGYAQHEEDVYTALADARAKLNSASTPEEYTEANASFESALSRLLVVIENYPELKADKNFIALQDQLEGTENRISVARKDYNDIATDYNTSIKKFPTVIFAGMFGFEKVDLFEATEESQTVPTVDFE